MKHLRILIADDHQLFLSGLRLLLRDQLGIVHVDEALDGQKAVEMARENAYDIILLDINMPVIDGITAAAEISIHGHGAKIMMVSMLSDSHTVTRALKAGVHGFIVKNASAADFREAFSRLLRDEIYLSPAVSGLFAVGRHGKLIQREEYIEFTTNLISPRERAVLKLVVEGHNNQSIAETLHLSPKTVETHRNNMLAKLDLPNVASLVRFAIENKLV